MRILSSDTYDIILKSYTFENFNFSYIAFLICEEIRKYRYIDTSVFLDKLLVLLAHIGDPNPNMNSFQRLEYKRFGKKYGRASFIYIFLNTLRSMVYCYPKSLLDIKNEYLDLLKPNSKTIEDLKFIINMGRTNIESVNDGIFCINEKTFKKIKDTYNHLKKEKAKNDCRIFPSTGGGKKN